MVERADQLFLLRIHADHRVPRPHEAADLIIDVAQLLVPIGM
jgi:hypothetical protein